MGTESSANNHFAEFSVPVFISRRMYKIQYREKMYFPFETVQIMIVESGQNSRITSSQF